MPGLPEGYRVKSLPAGYKPKERDSSADEMAVRERMLALASQMQMVNPRAMSAGMKLASDEDARDDLVALAGEAAANLLAVPGFAGAGRVIQFLRGLKAPALAAALKTGAREAPVVGRVMRAGSKATAAYEAAVKEHLAKQAASVSAAAPEAARASTTLPAGASFPVPMPARPLPVPVRPPAAPAGAPAPAAAEAPTAIEEQLRQSIEALKNKAMAPKPAAAATPAEQTMRAAQAIEAKIVDWRKTQGFSKAQIIETLKEQGIRERGAAKAMVEMVWKAYGL